MTGRIVMRNHPVDWLGINARGARGKSRERRNGLSHPYQEEGTETVEAIQRERNLDCLARG